MSLKLIACPHPFTSERITRLYNAGVTYQQIIEETVPCHASHTVGVMCNDEPISFDRWNECPPDNTTIYVRAVPAGADEVGDASGKVGIAGVLVGTLLIVAGVLTLNPALIAAGFWTFGGGVAIAAVGGLIAAAANFFESLTASGLEDSKQKPGIRGGRNRLEPWGIIPIVLGKTLVIPPYGARAYTEIGGTDGEEQYLRMLFVIGHGPLKVTQLKVGENLLATNVADVRNGTITVDGLFSGVDIEIKQAAGAMTLYPKLVVEEQPNIGLVCPGGTPTEVIRTTPPKTTQISVDITFQYGIVKYDDDGVAGNSSVNVVPEYRRKGDTTWLALGTWTGVGSTTITRAEAKTKRFTCVKSTLTAEIYEVRMRRITADSTDTKERNNVAWSALRSQRDDDPLSAVAQAAVVRLAVKIKATDQLNGIIDQLNVVAESVLPIYSGTGSGSAQWLTSAVTRNPASIFLSILRGPTNPRPIPDSKIDFAALEAWYTYCATKSFSCDSVIGSADTMRSMLTKLAGVGRATLSMRDGLYTVVVDNARTVPVQYFTPRNSHSFKGSKAFPEKVHALKIAFINADQNYAVDQCIVYDDGFDAGNATNFESVDAWGITSYDHAWKEGRYLIACKRLRPEVFSLSVDVEHLVCTRGDLVAVSHDLPLWGICAGRIKSVILDGSNNITSITIDEACTMVAGKAYGVKIRNNAGTGILAAIDLNVGEQTTIIPTTPIPAASNVEVGNLFMFGESGLETIDCIVAGIQINDDLSADLTLIEYAPDIQTADTGAIPAFDSKITVPAPIVADAVTTAITIPPAGPPGPQGPSAGGGVAPTNNVTNVVFTSSLNADGTVRVAVTFDYAQGANKADAAHIYVKANVAAPSAFNYAVDRSEAQALDADGSYGWYGNFPVRIGGGVGGSPWVYRFGVVAGSGALLHAAGAVTPTGWDAKTFTAKLEDIDIDIFDTALTAYYGSGKDREFVRLFEAAIQFGRSPENEGESIIGSIDLNPGAPYPVAQSLTASIRLAAPITSSKTATNAFTRAPRGVTYNGKIIYCGSTGTYLEIYDPVANTWTYKTMPTQYHIAMLVYKDKLYLPCSNGSNYRVEIYDLIADSWSYITTDPSLMDGLKMIAYQNKIWIFETDGKTVVYDVATTAVTQLNYALGCGGVLKDIIAIGNTLVWVNDTHVGLFDFKNLFVKGADAEIAIIAKASSWTANEMFVVGGLIYMPDYPNSLMRTFDINSQTFASHTVPTATAQFVLGEHDGYIYTLQTNSTSLYRFNTRDKTNTTLTLSATLILAVRAFFNGYFYGYLSGSTNAMRVLQVVEFGTIGGGFVGKGSDVGGDYYDLYDGTKLYKPKSMIFVQVNKGTAMTDTTVNMPDMAIGDLFWVEIYGRKSSSAAATIYWSTPAYIAYSSYRIHRFVFCGATTIAANTGGVEVKYLGADWVHGSAETIYSATLGISNYFRVICLIERLPQTGP